MVKSRAETIRVNGKRYELPGTQNASWSFEVRPGGWVLGFRTLADGTQERVRFSFHSARGQIGIQLLRKGAPGRTFRGEWIEKTFGSGGAGAGSDADLVAQFPGKVRKVLVHANQKVQEGDPLVMIEAMKMEFPVKAPFAGTVRKVLVKDGQQLSPGDRFVEFEEARG